ncbi:MAG: hypothetical protein IPK69_05160 [Phycisphaerales bacterium]|nr:MAG: hypothetical protein IPK69_05160 [Phycisphaerales bacterium]
MTLSPVVVLLALALIGLVAWKLVIMNGVLFAPGQSAIQMLTNNQEWSKRLTGHVIAVFFFLAVSGGIGAFAYFVSRRSDQMLAIGMAIPLLLGCGIFGYQLYRFYSPSKPMATPPTVTTAPSNARPTPTPSTSPPSPTPTRPAPSPSPASPTGPATPISPAPTRPPLPSPFVPNANRPPAPVHTPASARYADVVSFIRETDPAAADVLEPLLTEVDAQTVDVLAQLDSVKESLVMKRRPTAKQLDERIIAANAASAAARALGMRMLRLSSEAMDLLRQNNVSTTSAGMIATYTRGGIRKSAADRIADYLDVVADRAKFLKENPAGWVLKPGGVIEIKDNALRSKLHIPNFKMETFESREQDARDSLQGNM